MTSFGFCLCAAPGGASLQVLGGSQQANLVSSFEHEGHLAAVAGRLHYRQDALARLRVGRGFSEPASTNDAALALGTYLGSGVDGLARLEGEFALTVWDASARRLVGRRDPLGSYPLYWVRAGHHIAFATSLPTLVRLLPVRALDLDYLAGFLLTGRTEQETEASAYEGVQRVRADTIVTVEDGRVARRVYWDWLSQIVDPGTGRLESVAGHYRYLLRDAVRERMGELTACQVSGGMDSTAVGLLALDLVRSGAARSPLHGFSLVYERMPQLARERPYIGAALRDRGDHLVPHLVEADDLLDFDCFSDSPPHDEPFHALAAMTTERALVEEAAACGASTMLTGRGGDDLVVSEPNHIADLIRSGRPVSAWKEACRFALARGSNGGTVFRQHGLRHVVPWHALAARVRRHPRLQQLDDCAVPPWVSPAFARRHDLRARARANGRSFGPRGLPIRLGLGLRQLEHRVGDPYRWALAAPLGMSLSHPFLDPRLVALALGALGRLQPSAESCKPLLAEATRGLLPETIRTRRGKRSFNEVYYLGLRRNLAALETLVQSAPGEILGIDSTVLLRYMEDATLGIADPRQSFAVDTTLALLKWLSMATSSPVEVPS